MKYRPEFPDRFGSIQDSRRFGHVFFPWYNTEHRHSGLGMLTPHEVHYGLAEQRVEARARVLAAAFAAHPERFVAGQPRPPAVPTEVWINKPKAALAEPNRDSEPEVVTNFASRAPHSHATDSTHTQVSPESASVSLPDRSARTPHRGRRAAQHGGSTLNSETDCLILIDRLRQRLAGRRATSPGLLQRRMERCDRALLGARGAARGANRGRRPGRARARARPRGPRRSGGISRARGWRKRTAAEDGRLAARRSDSMRTAQGSAHGFWWP